MKIEMRRKKTGLSAKSTCLTLLALVLAATFTAPAFAFQFGSGDLKGSFDSTLSYGLAWRMEDQDPDLIGLANGGNAYSLNFDDGNLNYDKGDLINNTAKITSELALQYKNFGLFVRGTAFYDFENNDGDRARTPLSDEALDMVGKDAELLDAYITWDFDVAKVPGQIRVGSQVLSWGESTFIQNGINVINPFDVSKLRVAGAELKEGLIPVGMVSASISPTNNITFEGFYQYDWEEVKIDPSGSYWSTNDFAGEGGDRVMLGFGQWSDQGESWTGLVIPGEVTAESFNMVPRGSNVYADDDGQYGVAMRVYAPNLNDTEFGFYYMNYHSRLPVISARTGSALGALKTTTAGTAAGTFAALYDPTNPASAAAAITAGITAGTTVGVTGGLDPVEAQAISTGAINAATAGGSDLASAYAVNEFAQTAEYIIEYPEDIQLFGVSFNTTLGASGVALQGEISHRLDVPLQMDDIELIFAALGPINPPLATYNQIYNATGQYEYYIQGYKRLDVTQAQMTATKLFGPTFGADQFALVGEVGLTHVHGMPDKDELRMDGPGTPISGNELLASAHYGETESSSAFADANSWGYRLVAKLDFNNAIGAVTLSPRVAWSHDVNGTTPGPGGNFIDGRKAVTLGLGANYQNQWTADLSYTDYFGAGRYNLINDRDFLAFNIKYSF